MGETMNATTECKPVKLTMEDVKAVDDSMYAYNPAYTAALDKAIDSLRASSAASCGDTISRQEAIDALEKAMCEDGFRSATGLIHKTTAYDIIRHLPAAQSEIIRCKDCKYAEIADPEDNQDGYTCQFHRGSIWFSGSYCSWAERREE